MNKKKNCVSFHTDNNVSKFSNGESAYWYWALMFCVYSTARHHNIYGSSVVLYFNAMKKLHRIIFSVNWIL